MLKDRLSQLRSNKRCTQQEVSDFLGINRVTYAKYEGGTVEPSKDNIIKLADFFRCTTDYLFGLTDNPKEDLELTEEEQTFLDVYSKAKQSDQESVKDMLAIIDKMLNKNKK